MLRRHLLRIAVGAAVFLGGLTLPACQSTAERPQSLTGQVNRRAAPRYESHGKGLVWGRVVYDRD